MSDFDKISRMDLSKLEKKGYHPEEDEDIEDEELVKEDQSKEDQSKEDQSKEDQFKEGDRFQEGEQSKEDDELTVEVEDIKDSEITVEDGNPQDVRTAVTVYSEDGESSEDRGSSKAGESPEAGESTEDGDAPEDGDGTQADGQKKAKKQHMAAPTGQHYYIDAKVTTKEMTAFLFAHNYRSPIMLFATLIGLVWPIYTVIHANGSVLFACVCAGVFLVLMPVSIWRRGTTSIKNNPIYENTFHYMIDEVGVHVELADYAADVPWDKVTRKMFLNTSAVIYTGKVNAYLIPTVAMGDKKDEIIQFIKAH